MTGNSREASQYLKNLPEEGRQLLKRAVETSGISPADMLFLIAALQSGDYEKVRAYLSALQQK